MGSAIEAEYRWEPAEMHDGVVVFCKCGARLRESFTLEAFSAFESVGHDPDRAVAKLMEGRPHKCSKCSQKVMKKTDPEDKLRALAIDLAQKSGEILRDNLHCAGGEGNWSVKDMAASVCTWLDKTRTIAAKAAEPVSAPDTLPTLADARQAVQAAKKEVLRPVDYQPRAAEIDTKW